MSKITRFNRFMIRITLTLATAIVACCLSQPSRALDIGQFVQLFVLGSHAAIHLTGGTTLVDYFSNDMRVDGSKLFISYWFNSVSQGASEAFYLISDPDPASVSPGWQFIWVSHEPGTSWGIHVSLNCVVTGRSACDHASGNGARLLFVTPEALPNDAPCNCWHHIMASIDTSVPSGTYALDGGTGTLSIIYEDRGPTFVGPGGVIPYSVGNKWALGYFYQGDLAEFYINTLQTFNVATEQRKFRLTDSNHAQGLGNSSMNHAACEGPGSTPEVCLRGNVAHFLTQEDVDTQAPRHVFSAAGNPIEQAFTDPCAFSFFTGCEVRLP